MAKRMMADVLWEAANKWLHPSRDNVWAFEGSGQVGWSCHAISAALNGSAPKSVFSPDYESAPWVFVRELGCDLSSLPMMASEQRQGVRYMWLLLAMHIAEDEGLTC